MSNVQLGYTQVIDPISFKSIPSGKIYIGEYGTLPNPANAATWKQAYFVNSDGTRTAASQPIRTNAAGYAVDGSGNIKTIQVDGGYSLLVQDQYGATKFSQSCSAANSGAVLEFDTIAGFTGALDGSVCYFKGRDTVGDGGGGMFRYSASSTATADGGIVFAPAGGGRLFREDWQVASPAWFADIDAYKAAGFSIIHVDAPPYRGDLVAAYNDIPASGKVALLLSKRTYNILSLIDNVKPDVAIIGAGVPRYDNATRRLLDGTGTVLQGSVYNSAKGFWIDNLGIDRGEWVRTNLAGGVYRDTYVNLDFGENAGIKYGNLIVLQSEVVIGNPASYTHCILTERGSVVYQTGPVEVIDGYHGHVIKVGQFYGNGRPTIGRYQYGDVAIVKSDAGAKTRNVRMGDIIIDGDASRWSAGVLIEAQTQSLDDVSFGRIIAKHARWAFVEAAATNAPIVGVTVEGIKGSLISGIGAGAAFQVGSHFVDFTCGWHQLNSCDQGGVHVRPGAVEVDIGSGFSKNSSGGDGYKFEADTKHGKISAVTNAGWGVNNISNKLLNAQDVLCKDNTTGGISSLQTVPVTLQNSWADGSGTFRLARYGSTVRVSGNLSGGTVGSGYTWVTVATIATMRPVFDEYISCVGYEAGGAPKPMAARITSAGEIQVYGMAPQSVTGFFLSGSYTVQGNQ